MAQVEAISSKDFNPTQFSVIENKINYIGQPTGGSGSDPIVSSILSMFDNYKVPIFLKSTALSDFVNSGREAEEISSAEEIKNMFNDFDDASKFLEVMRISNLRSYTETTSEYITKRIYNNTYGDGLYYYPVIAGVYNNIDVSIVPTSNITKLTLFSNYIGSGETSAIAGTGSGQEINGNKFIMGSVDLEANISTGLSFDNNKAYSFRISASCDYPNQSGGFGIALPLSRDEYSETSVYCMYSVDYAKMLADNNISITDMGDLDYIIFANESLLHFAIREVATGNILFVINTNQLIASGNTYPICLAISEDKKWEINNITLI